MGLPTHHEPCPFPVEFTLTAGKLASYHRCPLAYSLAPPAYNPATPQAQQGRYTHAVLERYNRTLLAGGLPDVDALMARARPPRTVDGADLDEWTEHARACLYGWQALLKAEGYTVLAVERYLRSGPHAIAGTEAVRLGYAGVLDVIVQCPEHGHGGRDIAVFDFKTGLHQHLPDAATLAENPASLVPHLLVAHTYGVARVLLAQVAPHEGLYTAVMLTPDQIASHTVVAQQMAVALTTPGADHPARPNATCCYCGYRARCPALQRACPVGAPLEARGGLSPVLPRQEEPGVP